jgi:hypothetical protein
MKPPNTYLCALATSLLALACIQSVKAEEENCCGDTRYDPASEECCGGTTPVPKGRCCNGEELEEGFECCNKLTPPRPYNSETTCCTDNALYAKTAIISDIKSKCPDSVQREDYVKTANGCGTEGFNWKILQYASYGFVSWNSCCNGHDYCYQDCGYPQISCDNKFLSCMTSKCASDIPTPLLAILFPNCALQATAYYGSVLAGGKLFSYNDAQDQACQCCP